MGGCLGGFERCGLQGHEEGLHMPVPLFETQGFIGIPVFHPIFRGESRYLFPFILPHNGIGLAGFLPKEVAQANVQGPRYFNERSQGGGDQVVLHLGQKRR